MKNQYFGDINDYRKYGLLRCLTGYGQLTTAVCWMLTADDTRTDGRFIKYLQNPAKWREYDASLFDALHAAVITEGRRGVSQAEEKNLLPGAWFYTSQLTDNAQERADYFASFFQDAAGKDLIFFDPDNGMEVKSKRYGRKNSSKYLYWKELTQAFETGSSVLVYQHFRREKRGPFMARMAAEFEKRTGCETIYAFHTSNVVFLLLIAAEQRETIEHNITKVREQWRGQIEVLKIIDTSLYKQPASAWQIMDLRVAPPDAHYQAAKLLVEGFKEHWPNGWPNMTAALEEIEEALEPRKICRAAINSKGIVLGWIGGLPHYDNNAWELHPLVVHPAHQGQGIGRALVTDLEAQVRAKGSITLYLGTDDEDNMTSLSQVDLYKNTWEHIANIQNLKGHPYEFYQNLGFTIVGVLPDANGLDKPDILMAKRIV